jgi:hypothetical protein
MNTIQFSHTTNEDNTMNTLPNLPFSIEELDSHTHYLGVNTRGTSIFFDAVTGSIYRWNPKTGYFRRNSSHTFDGRGCLVVNKKISELDYDTFQHYIDAYRKTIRSRQQRKQRRRVVQYV